jgi:hypothetical protein
VIVSDIYLNSGTSMTPLYLEPDECLALLQALAFAANPLVQHELVPLPADPTECSRLIWDSEVATPVQRSLATALAEATYR